jgi:putative ABC transport system ATP-binding protein
MSTKEDQPMPIVETEQLSKVYGKGETAVTALDSVNLRIEPGEFVAVMGPSGCGKSTLLHLLGGLDQPTRGRVKMNSLDLAQLNDDDLTELRRRRIGFVFQFFNLIPVLGAGENAALPLILDGVKPAEAQARAAEWLRRVGLPDRLNHRPDQLSGGEQQRVAIARALITEPAVILADEPTGNLDSKNSDAIIELIEELNAGGATIVVITHNLEIAESFPRVVRLRDGQIESDTAMSAAVSAVSEALL